MKRWFAILVALLLGSTLPSCSRESSQEQSAAEAPDAAPMTQESPAPSEKPSSALFPLAVGNSWTYRCSADGEDQFEKTLRLASVQESGGIRFFRGELVVGGDANPVVTYYFSDESAAVHQSPEPSTANSEMLVTDEAKPGDTIGDRKAAAIEAVEVPALGTVQALRIENFAFDDPQRSEEDRMMWDARFYAPGVGPVIEADGSGAECVLTKYELARP